MTALTGRTIVVTRAAAQAAPFTRLLEAAGARVLAAPAIAIEPPDSWAPLDAALDAIGTFAWVVFTSVNGVAMVDRRLRERGQDWPLLGKARVAAIGPATAAALAERGLHASVVPGEYRAEALVEGLRPLLRAGDRVLLPRAARARDVLVVELGRLGALVTEVPAYTTRAASGEATAVREAVRAGTVDAVTFTSSSTARNFAQLFSDEERRRWFQGVTVASIGPITAATAAEYGLQTAVMPSEYTIPALARALETHFARAAARPDRPDGRSE